MPRSSHKHAILDNNKYLVPEDLYLLPSGEDENLLLYRPSVNTVTLISPSDAGLIAGHLKSLNTGGQNHKSLKPGIIKQLALLGFLETGANPEPKTVRKGFRADRSDRVRSRGFSPYEVTLDITRICNMRCIYCYAAGGDTPITMSKHCGYAAIDLCIPNAKREGAPFALHFHGGGEPSQEYLLLKDLYQYAVRRAKEERVVFKSSVITNGMINEEVARFYLDHFDEMTISLDGDESAQNTQRPTKGGKASYKHVFRTAKYFLNNGKKFNIRATITSLNVERLVNIARFLRQEFPACTINFEPVALVGRAHDVSNLKCNPEVFADNLYAAMKIVASAGGMVLYSGISAHSARTDFCAASAPSFCVGADGTVTSCFSYSNQDIIRELFIYGKYDPQANTFRLDNDGLSRLRSLPTNAEDYCKSCFCRTHCYGDCPAVRSFEVDEKGNLFEKRNGDFSKNRRCSINRRIMLLLLNDVARGRIGDDCLKIKELAS